MFIDLVKERYSVRSYAEKEVEEEKLNQVLEAGLLAPTAKNIQPQRIYLLKSEEALNKVRELTRMLYNAPMAFLFAVNKDEEWNNPLQEGFTSGHQDVSICATQMMLEAAELGLGTVWVNYFPQKEVHDALGLPENEEVVLLLPIGYPSETSKPVDNHTKKRPLEEIYKVL